MCYVHLPAARCFSSVCKIRNTRSVRKMREHVQLCSSYKAHNIHIHTHSHTWSIRDDLPRCIQHMYFMLVVCTWACHINTVINIIISGIQCRISRVDFNTFTCSNCDPILNSLLDHKQDKLLNKLEETEPDPPTSQEDECVICINARATMQTSPCGHRVVCRRCFVKTIQSAVAQRLLPLRCVICRTRITRLTSSSGTCLRLQESASSYSMATSSRLGSWATGLGMSPSSYSVGAGGIAGARGGSRVAQSTSLYSMSSGASFVSGK